MSKPDDISQEAWNTATKLVSEIFGTGDYSHTLSVEVARALMAETERCARLADAFTDHVDIAHFIRSGRKWDVNTAHTKNNQEA